MLWTLPLASRLLGRKSAQNAAGLGSLELLRLFPFCRLLCHRFTLNCFTMKSREGGSLDKHWVGCTLLAQLLTILVGFWVGIQFGNTSRTPLLFRGCTPSLLNLQVSRNRCPLVFSFLDTPGHLISRTPMSPLMLGLPSEFLIIPLSVHYLPTL